MFFTGTTENRETISKLTRISEGWRNTINIFFMIVLHLRLVAVRCSVCVIVVIHRFLQVQFRIYAVFSYGCSLIDITSFRVKFQTWNYVISSYGVESILHYDGIFSVVWKNDDIHIIVGVCQRCIFIVRFSLSGFVL